MCNRNRKRNQTEQARGEMHTPNANTSRVSIAVYLYVYAHWKRGPRVLLNNLINFFFLFLFWCKDISYFSAKIACISFIFVVSFVSTVTKSTALFCFVFCFLFYFVHVTVILIVIRSPTEKSYHEKVASCFADPTHQIK